ncbi:MAG: plasmid stabilization protein [Candidatus Marinimicrobia bacterium]|nr:plasmid stabilization protein [Candidatus Neomarinimicrobiota bacterium]MBT3478876.1 plasmid stabilization protein [Candidatus Neomarinimicrobiota bacterium]MBT3762737.1 plasmid stabilization protein [Candidatus Neomarinimicrobiota bacterium]MBT4269922.1 plasmid stabilization protein [Candidatus Neomarinimicrobiota bacterium]MBT4371280.1 plasmid stabilization protein [Candidatus Neomarinimicrobiota bacterium]
MYTIQTPPAFLRTAKKFFKFHPDLKERFHSIIEILHKHPTHSSLKLHSLSGKLKGLHGISLTYKYRITLMFKIENKTIILLDIGNHDEVYSK